MQTRLMIGVLLLLLVACGESSESSNVQPIARTEAPLKTFVESDFYWDATLEPYKSIIISGVNMVHRDNSTCRTIDPSSAYISTNRGSASDPVFYVTCGSNLNTTNVFFSKSDVESGATMRAPAHIARATAIQECEDYAKANVNQPDSVSFSQIMDLAVTEHPNGRTTVISSFTAKNTLGVEQSFDIRCLYDGTSFLEGVINESN